MKSNSQHPFFPFFSYYPCMFAPQWTFPLEIQGQRPPIQEKQISSQVSLPQTPTGPIQQNRQEPQKISKTSSQPNRKQKERQQLKSKKEREDDYERKKQKKDRNLPSSIFKSFATFLHAHPSAANYVQRHCPRSVAVDPEVFLAKFKEVIRNGQSYIRPSTMQSLCREGVFTPEESLVFRIILRRFTYVQFPTQILQQQKLKKSQKISYLKLSKTLHRQLNLNSFK